MLEEYIDKLNLSKELNKNLNNFCNSLERIKPIKFYRKFRVRKRIKKRYMIRYNKIAPFLIEEAYFVTSILKRLIK